VAPSSFFASFIGFFLICRHIIYGNSNIAYLAKTRDSGQVRSDSGPASEIGLPGSGAENRRTRSSATALDAGINVIDTAECYANGEQLIGKALAHRRAEVTPVRPNAATRRSARVRIGNPRCSRRVSIAVSKICRTDHVRRDGSSIAARKKRSATTASSKCSLTRAEAARPATLDIAGDSEDALYAVEMGIFDTLQISLSIADQEAIDVVSGPKADRARDGRDRQSSVRSRNAAWRSGKQPPIRLVHAAILGSSAEGWRYDFLGSDVEEGRPR